MIGATVSTKNGLYKGFDHGTEWKCDCIQIYTTPSRTWQVPALKQAVIDTYLSSQVNNPDIQVISHVPFLVNLASPNDGLWHQSIQRLEVEIKRASSLGINLVVLHPGSTKRCKKQGIKRIADALNLLWPSVASCDVKICLETMAGQGNSIGSKLEDLAGIMESVDCSSSISICLDTAHMFEAGYELMGRTGYQKVMDEVDTVVGLSQIGVIHLNDSVTKSGSRVDRHAFIGEGLMGLEVFHSFLNDPLFSNIPKIVEMPRSYERVKEHLSFLRQLKSRSIQEVKEMTNREVVSLPAQEVLF